ncbi:MAG TPA: protein-disulfide reductase DsbD [Thiobacillaceae bacterium]|nr:protein-disulfide reductase DsbD [Thiobacillaceae bacterium]
MRFFLAFLLLFALHAQAEDDLLEPEKAFRYSARMLDPATAEARFQIASGYYLYRAKIKFAAEGDVKLGSPELPPGKVKQDDNFGKVETYRGDIRVRIPVSYPGGEPRPFKLKANFQGCADLGVCYQPQDGVAALVPPTATPAAPAATPAAPAAKSAAPAAKSAATPAASAAPAPGFQQQNPEVLAKLKALAGNFAGGSPEPDVLPPDEAFKVAVAPGPGGTLVARFTVAKDHYLYRDKIRFTVTEPAGVTVAGMDFPPADEKDDPNFGKMFVFHQDFAVTVRLAGVPPGTARLKLDATYQGCSEHGICYPPQDQNLEVDLGAPVATPANTAPAPAAAPGDGSDTSRVTAILQGGSYWMVVASFFGFGLLLSLTPCVFPMIPILSGIIVGQGQHITKRKGFLLSLAYVLGMAMTYALAGVAAGLSGTLISNALQNPWALGFGAAIFVALAMSMFGFFELQMPSFLQSRFTEASNRIQGGRFASVFVMGAISALIVGPCVAAPLAGALLYISQTGDVVLGGVSLFSLALGMGVPLLLVGLSAGALLPRAGAWMDAVKRFFGVALLAVAIWLVSPLLSEVAQMFMWAALLIISAMYLHALEPLAVNARGFTRFWKGVGLIALVAGVALLLGALGGSRDLLQPLSVYKGGVANAAEEGAHMKFQRVKSVAELDAAVKGAAGRPVMLDFYADWCVSCKEMERFTFADAKVQARLKDALLLQADVTANGADDKALLARFKLFGPPGIIFFDKAGNEVAYRVIGYEPPEKFLASLDKAIP